jgi:hypothetical protein
MDPVYQSYILLFLLYASMTTITVTVLCEYLTSKKTHSKTNQLITPCYITSQNTGYNLIFIAIPMGLIMTCKLHVAWNLGAIGILAVSEAVCNISIYAMNQLWQHHYTLIVMGFTCTCFQLLILDLFNAFWFPWRWFVYFVVQIMLEVSQLVYVYRFHPEADIFKQGEGFSTFKSACIIAMDLFSIWSNVMYTDVILSPPEELIAYHPLFIDVVGGAVVWIMFLLSLLLCCLRPQWPVWDANRIGSIDAL